MSRTAEREEFLSDVLVSFIENYGALSWFTVNAYVWEDERGPAYAMIADDEGKVHRVDLDTVAKGIGIIANAEVRHIASYCGPECVDRESGARLDVSEHMRKRVMLANRDYDEAVNLDAIDASAIVECALYGHVVYA